MYFSAFFINLYKREKEFCNIFRKSCFVMHVYVILELIQFFIRRCN
jgi:hypothetical protein